MADIYRRGTIIHIVLGERDADKLATIALNITNDENIDVDDDARAILTNIAEGIDNVE